MFSELNGGELFKTDYVSREVSIVEITLYLVLFILSCRCVVTTSVALENEIEQRVE